MSLFYSIVRVFNVFNLHLWYYYFDKNVYFAGGIFIMNKNILMLGGICIDKYHLIKAFPKVGSDTLIKSEFNTIGGCPINVAHTLKNLGLNPIIYSAVGKDSKNEIYDYLNKFNMNTECIFEASEEKTGYCIILSDESGERTFLTYKGCEGFFDHALIPQDILEATSYIYLTGILLTYEYNNNNLISFLKSAIKLGKKLIFDPGPLLNTINPLVLREILQLSYLITPSHDELLFIKKTLGVNSPKELFKMSDSLEYIVETHGSNGCQLYSESEHIIYPSLPASVKDTNGAGDSFVGGIIYGLSTCLSINDTISIGSACGAISTEHFGCSHPFSIDDVNEKLCSHQNNFLEL